MSRRGTLLVCIAGLSLTTALVSTIHAASAQRDLRAERSRSAQLADDVGRLEALRSVQASAQAAEPPEEDVLRSVGEAIRRAGFHNRAFTGLASSGDQAVRGREGYRRKSYRLDLQGLDVTDLGGFLEVWLASEPLWSIEEIELRRRAGGRGRNAPDGFAVSVTIASVYAAAASARSETLP